MLSIIIPTKNEAQNILELVGKIEDLNINKEVIIVDDGEDDLPFLSRQLNVRFFEGDRKGLGSAIIKGINFANGDIIVVMDGDGSHNPYSIPSLIKPLEQGYDMTIGSRYVEQGGLGNWSFVRKLRSIIGVKSMELVTGVKDSNSGFFAFKKKVIEGVTLKPSSWKIMLEVLFKGNITARKEVPIVFEERWAGESKNNDWERAKHAWHLIKLLVYKFPKRYINFAIVGGIGAIAYFVLFWILTDIAGIWYGYSYFLATMYAIVQNYFLNHIITFRKQKHLNTNHFKGIMTYTAGSWFGELVEYAVMILLVEVFGFWYILADFIGSGFSSVIKYTLFRKKIWGEKPRTSDSADYEWHSYFKGLPWQKRWKRKIATEVSRMAGNAGVVLDIGSGSSPLFTELKYSEYCAMDPNVEKLKFLKEKAPGIDIMPLPIQELKQLKGVNDIDTILCIETIEHLPNYYDSDHAIMDMASLVKEGGQIIIATPDYGNWQGKWMDRLYGVFQKNGYKDGHLIKFDLELLTEMGKENGLELVEHKSLSGADLICKFTKP